MDILRAEINHFDDVYKLICELENAEVDEQKLLDIYKHNLNDKNIFYFVAIDGKNVIGFASFHVQQLLHHAAKIAEIQEIIICKDWQGRGIGSYLFENIMRTAIDADCLQLEVCCNQLRDSSHKFYLKQGMKNSHYKFTLPLSQ